MQPSSFSDELIDPSFDMHFPLLLPTLGEPWIASETADVSVANEFRMEAERHCRA
jgi:hypothetical protein